MEYRFFSDAELGCQCDLCKDNPTSSHMDETFMRCLIKMREELGFALPVSSAYRCPMHPIEAGKSSLGSHSSGKAVDIKLSGSRAYKLLRLSMSYGILGIGISQKGEHSSRFIHLDIWDGGARPALWSY